MRRGPIAGESASLASFLEVGRNHADGPPVRLFEDPQRRGGLLEKRGGIRADLHPGLPMPVPGTRPIAGGLAVPVLPKGVRARLEKEPNAVDLAAVCRSHQWRYTSPCGQVDVRSMAPESADRGGISPHTRSRCVVNGRKTVGIGLVDR